MKIHNSCVLTLTLAATMLISGCALKPRQQSRFHNTGSDGNCGCYTCQHDEGSSAVEQEYVESYETTPSTVNEVQETPEVEERPLYQLPEASEPVVSSDSFSVKKYEAEPAVINEVQPEDNYLKLDSESELKLDGGDFKSKEEITVTPTEPAKSLNIFETAPDALPAPKAPKLPEAAPAKAPVVQTPDPVSVPDLKPAPTTETLVAPKTDPAPDSVFTPKPVEVSKPVEAPKSTFKPGDAFKPRKRKVKPLDSSSLEQTSGGRIVLQANPVDRNIVNLPPTKGVAQVVVPALRSSFKNEAPGNSLRSLAHTSQPAYQPETQVAVQEVQQAPAPVRIAEAQPLPTRQAQPKSIPVRLRAIPTSERMIQAKQVQVRFSQELPRQQVSEDLGTETLPPQQIPKPVLAPRVEVEPPTIEEVADPAPPITLHTASAENSSEFATPPWRIK